MFRWFFVTHLIVDKNLDISDAFEYSGKLATNIFWDIFAIGILNWFIKGLGGISVIGWIFTVPLTGIVISKFYLERLDFIDKKPIENDTLIDIKQVND